MMPEELKCDPDRLRYLEFEYRLAKWACGVIPILIVLALPLTGSAFSFVINLRQPVEWVRWDAPFDVNKLLVGVLLSAGPVLWMLCLRIEKKYLELYTTRRPVAALAAGFIILALCVLFQSNRVQWFFLEAVKVRAELASYPRAVAFWGRDSMDYHRARNARNILLIGSSQMNYAVETTLMNTGPKLSAEKKCLPGFGIMQYLMIVPEVLRQKPDAVVCWISEFDAFREDRLPSNRLRYFSGFPQAWHLYQVLSFRELWQNRAEFADIFLAGVVPLWRERDSLRLLANDFWWGTSNKDVRSDQKFDDNEAVKTKKLLAQSIRRTELVDANFRAFLMFARLLASNNIRLYVFEGKTNPLMTTSFDPAFRLETRSRLSEMAAGNGFIFEAESRMPVFASHDFGDGYHLNKEARARFTLFLKEYLLRELQ